MGSGNSLLQILETRLDEVKERVADEFRRSDSLVFEEFDDEELKNLAWSHIDPIIQSLRYDDDYLFTFFLEYASGRNAEQGLPIEDSLLTLNIVSRSLWEVVIAESKPEFLIENLLRLNSILAKGKDGIASNYLHQRDYLLEELRKSNGKLMEVTKRRLDFLAKVSHELKTPLTSVIAYAEQLKNSKLPDEIRNEFIDVIHGQSNKLYQLIEDLLDLSKAENDQSHLNLSWSDLEAVLQEAISTVEARAAEKQITLTLVPPRNLPKIYMDPFRIQQVVWNLLTNGVKYNKTGGEVKVSVRRRDDEIVVDVADNGIGIKKENLVNIFDLFHQTHDAMAMLEGGAGLGLDIARHYLNLHGGDLQVESDFGKGSTFSFTLPIYGPQGHEEETLEIPAEVQPEACPQPPETVPEKEPVDPQHQP